LHARSDGHCDHVLFQAFFVTNARIATGREYIDKTIFSDYFQPDLGVPLKESRNDGGQRQACGDDRHVEP